jgi:hypothetical protein
MQLLLTRRGIVDACQTIHSYPCIFERMLRSLMRRVEACIESHEGHFEHLLEMYSFSHNSQIKCFRTRVDIDIFSCLGMWNSCPKFVRTFQLHPAYRDYASARPHLMTLSFFLSFFLNPFFLYLYGVQVFFYFDHFTDGRTSWTRDQFVAGPPPKHRTTQTQNKHIHIPNIHALCGIRTYDPGSERAKTVHALDRSATVTSS